MIFPHSITFDIEFKISDSKDYSPTHRSETGYGPHLAFNLVNSDRFNIRVVRPERVANNHISDELYNS